MVHAIHHYLVCTALEAVSIYNCLQMYVVVSCDVQSCIVVYSCDLQLYIQPYLIVGCDLFCTTDYFMQFVVLKQSCVLYKYIENFEIFIQQIIKLIIYLLGLSADAIPLEKSTIWKTQEKSFEMWICPLVHSLIGFCNDPILRYPSSTLRNMFSSFLDQTTCVDNLFWLDFI